MDENGQKGQRTQKDLKRTKTDGAQEISQN